jgi:hypothetical protein
MAKHRQGHCASLVLATYQASTSLGQAVIQGNNTGCVEIFRYGDEIVLRETRASTPR